MKLFPSDLAGWRFLAFCFFILWLLGCSHIHYCDELVNTGSSKGCERIHWWWE